MLANYYAQALHSVTKESGENNAEEYVSNLISILKRKGHMQLLPAILREYKKIKNVGKDNVVIRVADSEDDISIEKANKKYQESFDSSIKPQIETDRTLIGGFQIQSNSKMIDASYKNALVKLYQNMTI